MEAINITKQSILKTMLSQHGIEPSRSSGQNFLICNQPITKTLEHISNGPRQITELGAGHGPLTLALVKAGYEVRAIERDEKLLDIMNQIIPRKDINNLHVKKDDLKKAEWSWPVPYQLVGNIPYNLSGLILRRITELDPAPSKVIFLMQKEVGERLVARTPNMNMLALSVQLWGTPYRVLDVPADCFWPQPQVQSQLIEISPHHKPLFTKLEQSEILQVAKPLFQTKRKQLAGSMARVFNMERITAENILKQSNIKPSQRPQELSIEQWYKVTRLLRA